jgi:hypothetical protein
MAKENGIRLIAYNIWEQAGCINGKDCEHWFRAEAIWEEQEKSNRKNTNKESESPIPSVLITPPPNQTKLLSLPAKKSIRARHKKK